MRNSLFLYLMPFLLLIAGCSSRVEESQTLDSAVASLSAAKSCTGKECAVCELPWGGTLAAGQTTEEAFAKPLIECTETCDSYRVKLTCQDGQLSAIDQKGNKIDLIASLSKSCYKKKCDCTHAGKTVEDGQSETFFRNASNVCDAPCESRKFDCRSGKLYDSGLSDGTSTAASFTAASCSATACQSCTTPWGETIAHKGTVSAFKADVPACGVTCESGKVTLTCNNGSLTGGSIATYKFKTCQARACQNCTLPSGDIIAHNASLRTYAATSVGCGQACTTNSAVLKCSDGTITGGDTSIYKYTSCAAVACKTCTLPCGTTLASGGNGYCFRVSQPAACGLTCLAERKKFLCKDGVTTAEDTSDMTTNTGYVKTACNEIAACTTCDLPDGRKVDDGTKVTFFKASSVSCGQSCLTSANAVTLTCANGSFANQSLYQGFKETSCTANCNTTTGSLGIGRVNGDGGGAPVVWCILPWGTGIATHNSTIPAFSVARAPTGHKCSEYRALIKCNAYRGLWTGGGTYVYPKCSD